MLQYETLEHILFVCPQYKPWRTNLVHKHLKRLVEDQEDLILILRDPSEETLNNMYDYISCVLKHRKFICTE